MGSTRSATPPPASRRKPPAPPRRSEYVPSPRLRGEGGVKRRMRGGARFSKLSALQGANRQTSAQPPHPATLRAATFSPLRVALRGEGEKPPLIPAALRGR